MKVSKIIVSLVLIFFLGYGGLAFYKSQKERWEEKESEKQKLEKTFPGLCEAGRWINFSSRKSSSDDKNYKGKLKLKLERGRFSDPEKKYFFVSNEKYPLDYFVGKEVEISGTATGKKKGKEIAVEKIRCAGAEADKIKSAERQRLMNYLNVNINKLVLEPNANDKFKVAAFSFVGENKENKTVDLYVDLESASLLKGDDGYEARIWLVRASKLERPKPLIQELAFMEKKFENSKKEKTSKEKKAVKKKEIPYEKIILRGEDIYQDSNQGSVYNYDKIKKRWILQ